MHQVLNQILESTDIVQLFSELYPEARITRVGSGYKSLCPFHSEKTPSFHLDPSNGRFKCWGAGCGKRGNAIDLVKDAKCFEYLSQSIKYLAERSDIEISSAGWEGIQFDTNINKIMKDAWGLFKGYLKEEGNPVLDWIKIKNFDQWEHLSIGRYPNPKRLIKDLKGKGFEEDDIKRSGLVPVSKDDKERLQCKSAPPGKWLENCVVYPYHSTYDRIVRYKVRNIISTTETDHDERFLGIGEKGIYGLEMYDFRKGDQRCLMVEGETDVLAIQNLFKRDTGYFVQVLTGGGGANTINDFYRIGVLNIWIMADNDEGGKELVERFITENSTDVGISVIELPEDINDPYDLVQSIETSEDLKQVMEYTMRPCKWLARRQISLSKTHKGTEEEKVSWLRRNAIKYAACIIKNEMDMDDYIKEIAEATDCSTESLRKELQQAKINDISQTENSDLFLRDNYLFRRGREEERVSNFHIVIDKEKIFKDEEWEKRMMIGRIIGDRTWKFKITAPEFTQDSKLSAMIVNQCGTAVTFDLAKRTLNCLRRSAHMFSTSRKEEIWYSSGGWINKNKSYVSSSVIIEDGISRANTKYNIYYPEESKSRFLDLKLMDKSKEKEIYSHIIKDLFNITSRNTILPWFCHVLTPLVYPFISSDQRFIFWIYGTTGRGKSYCGRLFQSFYGDYFTEGRAESWSSTANKIQKSGYGFKDSLYFVDDWKGSSMGTRDVKQRVVVLQTYADFQARGRLKSDSTELKVWPIRGWLHCTGEDIPTGEASVIARSLLNPWEGTKKNVEVGKRCAEMVQYYPMVTTEVIRWIQAQADKSIFDKKYREFRDLIYFKFSSAEHQDEKTSNDLRISNNLATIMLCGWIWANFFCDKGAMTEDEANSFLDELTAILNRCRFNTMSLISSELKGYAFLRVLTSGLESGRFVLISEHQAKQNKNMDDIERKYQGKVVGFTKDRDPDHVLIWSDLSYGEVNSIFKSQGIDLGVSKGGLEMEWVQEGILIPDKSGRPTVAQRSHGWRGKNPRWWKFRRETLGIGQDYFDESDLDHQESVKAAAPEIIPERTDIEEPEENGFFGSTDTASNDPPF